MDAGGQMFTYVGMLEEPIPGEDDKQNIVCHYRKISDSMAIIYIDQLGLQTIVQSII